MGIYSTSEGVITHTLHASQSADQVRNHDLHEVVTPVITRLATVP